MTLTSPPKLHALCGQTQPSPRWIPGTSTSVASHTVSGCEPSKEDSQNSATNRPLCLWDKIRPLVLSFSEYGPKLALTPPSSAPALQPDSPTKLGPATLSQPCAGSITELYIHNTERAGPPSPAELSIPPGDRWRPRAQKRPQDQPRTPSEDQIYSGASNSNHCLKLKQASLI